MSKAFTRESDDTPDRPIRPRRASPLPPGARNYLTPDGASRLRQELDHLMQTERTRLTGLPQDDDTQRRLHDVNERIAYLQQSLQTAVVASPPVPPHEHAHFGATVTVREHHGDETRYRIVGVDETDIDRDWVSWLSPIAKALLNARLGQRVRLKLPSGERELEVVSIAYE